MERQLRIVLRNGNQVVVTIPSSTLISNALRSCGIPFKDLNLKQTMDNWNKDNNLSAKTCIVVDDDHQVLMSTADTLKDDGHFVLTYTNVKVAIDHLSNWLHADVAIVDYAMPKQKGDVLLNYMRINTDIPRLILRTASWDINVPDGVELSCKPYPLEIQ